MKNFFIVLLSLFAVLVSCKPKKPLLVTYDVRRTDFVEKITITGTLQAVNSVNIMVPQGYYGGLNIGWVKPEGSIVKKGDTICILKSQELMQQFDDQERTVKSIRAEYEKLVADDSLKILMLEAQLKENYAGMSINKLDSIQMLYAPPVKKRLMELELEKSRIEERKLRKKYQAEKAISETEIRQMKSRILQAENLMESLREKVNGLSITAPMDGVLTASEMAGQILISFGDGNGPIEAGGYPKPGGFLFPEIPLMALPDLSAMQVKIELQEVDYKKIEKGLPVEITVYSAGSLQTHGSVISKSMAPKYRYTRDGRYKYFEATISIDSLPAPLKPGLSAGCTILANNIKDTLVVPSLAIFQKDSSKVVYVEEGNRFRPVTVVTGLFNGSQTIIAKGLTGKETIALVEPLHQDIIKPKPIINE